MNIVDKIDAMIGKSFQVEGKVERVLRRTFSEENGNVSIVTDVQTHSTLLTVAHEYLKKFVLVSESLTVVGPSQTVGIIGNKSKIDRMYDIMFDNIERLKMDKEFIPQAQAMNEQIKSVIDLAKTEVMAAKMMNAI